MPETRDVRGMHLSNGPQWNVEQCLRAAGDAGAVTLLHHLMRDDPITQQHSDIENGRWYAKLRHGHAPQGIPPAPRRLIHVRMYHPNWMGIEPEVWARHSVDMLSAIDSDGRVYDLWDDPLVTVSPANEQNLHYECGFNDPATQPQFQTVEHYRKIAKWNAAWADEVNRLRPNRKATLCWPALAFGHEPPGFQPDGEYGVPELRAAIARYEIMATHPYALLHTHGPATAPGGDDAFFFMLRDFRPAGFDNPRDPGGVLAQIPDKPLLISEAGTFTHADPARTRETAEAMAGLYRAARDSGRVLGVTWFIWHSDAAHPTNQIWPNEKLRQWLERAPVYPTTAEVPLARLVAAPPPAPTPGGPMTEEDRALLAAAEAAQAIQFNPNAAIQREILADGFVPNSNEFDVTGGVGQRAERLSDGAVRAYRWRARTGKVDFVDRPTGPKAKLIWPVGSPESERYGVGLPAGWRVTVGYDQEYTLAPAGRPPVRNVHPGIDLDGPGEDLGQPIYAVAAGKVVASATYTTWGSIVLIEHELDGQRLWSQYAHLQRRDVKIGDTVTQGQVIGTLGNADGAYAPHLHFELRAVSLPAEAWPASGGASLALQHTRTRGQYLDPIGLLGV